MIPILEPFTHNEFTVKDSFSFAKDIITYDSSLYMASLDVESLFTNIPLNETINNCVSICTIKMFIMGNSAKETFSNFWKQQLANHLLFLITCFINKLTEWQWVFLWVPPLQMHLHAIMKKNGWICSKKSNFNCSLKELFIVLPYLGTLSSNLKQKLRACFKNSLP